MATRAKKTTRRAKLVSVEEPRLREYGSQGAVEQVHAVRAKSGYELQVFLSSPKAQPLLVYTQRGSPRAWASLDRLTAFVQRTFPGVAGLTVIF
jgi:hypothetical protein